MSVVMIINFCLHVTFVNVCIASLDRYSEYHKRGLCNFLKKNHETLSNRAPFVLFIHSIASAILYDPPLSVFRIA
jgi:hypothetical protein